MECPCKILSRSSLHFWCVWVIRSIDIALYSQLYAALPRVTVKIRERRMRLAGHCVRHPELAVSPLVLWAPVDGHRSKGRMRITFVDQLKKDATQQETTELRTLMLDRDAWKTIIRVSREGIG